MELVAARLDAKDCASMCLASVAGRVAVAAARLHRAERERLLALGFGVYMDYNVMRVEGGWSIVQSSLQLVQKDKSELQWLVSTGARDVTPRGDACLISACDVFRVSHTAAKAVWLGSRTERRCNRVGFGRNGFDVVR